MEELESTTPMNTISSTKNQPKSRRVDRRRRTYVTIHILVSWIE
jgi:hypothetical protein